jgi:hypothetical protein
MCEKYPQLPRRLLGGQDITVIFYPKIMTELMMHDSIFYIFPCLIQSQLRNAPNNETKNRAPNRTKYISNRLFSLIASTCSPNHINSPKKDSHMRIFGPIKSHRNPLSFMIVLPFILTLHPSLPE